MFATKSPVGARANENTRARTLIAGFLQEIPNWTYPSCEANFATGEASLQILPAVRGRWRVCGPANAAI